MMKNSKGTPVLLFVLAALVSVWVSFFLVEDKLLHYTVIYLSYPSLILTFSLFGLGLYRMFRREGGLPNMLPARPSAFIAIVAVSGLLLLFEPYEFKIVYDELILSATSQMMHFDRLAGMPRIATDMNGSFELMDAILDKRPLVFPFILSIVHDMLGFRYENVFILNTLLSVLLVGLIYCTGRIFGGHRGGLLSVLLTGTLPLLAIFTTSGHFEVLNLVMLCSLLILSHAYIRDPSETRVVPLVYCLVILSQVRYENSLYILPFGILILLGWRKAGRLLLPWQVIIVPVLYMLHSMNYRLILKGANQAFQEGPNGRVDTFSLGYAAENLSSAAHFLFSLGPRNSNSYLLSVMGLSSMILFCAYVFKRARYLTGRDARGTVAYFFVISIFLFGLVITFFNFGIFDQYVTNRLSLPIQLLFILLTPFIVRRFGKKYILTTLFVGLLCAVIAFYLMSPSQLITRGINFALVTMAFTAGMWWIWARSLVPGRAILSLPLICIFSITMPVGHAHRYSQVYRSNDVSNIEFEFIKRRSETEKILWISSAPYTSILTQTSSYPLVNMKTFPERVEIHLRLQNYNSIYISRLFSVDDDGNQSITDQPEFLDPEVFKLERVFERPVRSKTLLCIDRLVEIDLRRPPTEGKDDPPADEELSDTTD